MDGGHCSQLTYQCPFCYQRYSIDPSILAQAGECEKCGHSVRYVVPGVSRVASGNVANDVDLDPLTPKDVERCDGRTLIDIARIDRIAGLRAWGLLVYCSLPAYLIAFGVGKIPKELASLAHPLLTLLSVPLVLLTFSLVRYRHETWYLTRESLSLRAAIVSAAVLMISTSLCGVALLVHFDFTILPQGRVTWEDWNGVALSFNLAAVSFLASSTICTTALTSVASLPFLPTNEFVELLKTVKGQLEQLQEKDIWNDDVPVATDAEIEHCLALACDVEGHLAEIFALAKDELGKQSLIELGKDITILVFILKWMVKSGPNDRIVLRDGYFLGTSANAVHIDVEKRQSIWRIRNLNIGRRK